MDSRLAHVVKGTHRVRSSVFSRSERFIAFGPGAFLVAVGIGISLAASSSAVTFATLLTCIVCAVLWTVGFSCAFLYRDVKRAASFYDVDVVTWKRRNRAVWRGTVLSKSLAGLVADVDERVDEIRRVDKRGRHQSGGLVHESLAELREQRNNAVRALRAVSGDVEQGLEDEAGAERRTKAVVSSLKGLVTLADSTLGHMAASTSAREVSVPEEMLRDGSEHTRSMIRMLREDAESIREATRNYESR